MSKINKKIELDIIHYYNQKIPIKDILKIFRIAKCTFYRILKRNNVQVPGVNGSSNFTCDQYYFDNIDCEDKAYWLGFILADGCIRSKGNCLTINLSSIDIEHLNKFNKAIKSNRPLNHQVNQGTYGMSCLHVNNIHLTSCLKEKGIIAHNKRPFNIDEKLERHYWRGVIDGDGCLSVTIYNGKKPQPKLSLVGTRETIKMFQSFCIKYIDSKSKIVENSGGKNMDEFSIHGPNSMIISSILYEDSNIYLDRKKEKYFKIKHILSEWI